MNFIAREVARPIKKCRRWLLTHKMSVEKMNDYVFERPNACFRRSEKIKLDRVEDLSLPSVSCSAVVTHAFLFTEEIF